MKITLSKKEQAFKSNVQKKGMRTGSIILSGLSVLVTQSFAVGVAVTKETVKQIKEIK